MQRVSCRLFYFFLWFDIVGCDKSCDSSYWIYVCGLRCMLKKKAEPNANQKTALFTVQPQKNESFDFDLINGVCLWNVCKNQRLKTSRMFWKHSVDVGAWHRSGCLLCSCEFVFNVLKNINRFLFVLFWFLIRPLLLTNGAYLILFIFTYKTLFWLKEIKFFLSNDKC